MKEIKENFIEGFPLKAEEVKNAEDKTFEILKEPIYEAFEDQETKKVKNRLRTLIKFNGAEITYFPNKTSQAIVVAKKGRNLKNWIGFKGVFEVISQKVGNKTLDVIYIK